MSAHTITATTIGAGAGDTYYALTCVCGWHHEDYSAMNACDRGVLHQEEATR